MENDQIDKIENGYELEVQSGESFFEGGISFNMELGVLRRFGANTSGTVKSN